MRLLTILVEAITRGGVPLGILLSSWRAANLKGPMSTSAEATAKSEKPPESATRAGEAGHRAGAANPGSGQPAVAEAWGIHESPRGLPGSQGLQC